MRRLPIYVHIADGVYPVAEDTLLMLEAVEVRRGERFLEMGCGQGLVGLHAAKYGAEATLADIDPLAVECARRNGLENDLAVEVVQSDLFENIRGAYDVIVFNPPYLPGDTAKGLRDTRLDGGQGGIEVARTFL
ncbi:MAG: methyltransferase, partial [Candidatus Thermoplasmatota archaeon]|nr:methyltransferase [Candidatus Thermoplasmatota archaeon]